MSTDKFKASDNLNRAYTAHPMRLLRPSAAIRKFLDVVEKLTLGGHSSLMWPTDAELDAMTTDTDLLQHVAARAASLWGEQWMTIICAPGWLDRITTDRNVGHPVLDAYRNDPDEFILYGLSRLHIQHLPADEDAELGKLNSWDEWFVEGEDGEAINFVLACFRHAMATNEDDCAGEGIEMGTKPFIHVVHQWCPGDGDHPLTASTTLNRHGFIGQDVTDANPPTPELMALLRAAPRDHRSIAQMYATMPARSQMTLTLYPAKPGGMADIYRIPSPDMHLSTIEFERQFRDAMATVTSSGCQVSAFPRQTVYCPNVSPWMITVQTPARAEHYFAVEMEEVGYVLINEGLAFHLQQASAWVAQSGIYHAALRNIEFKAELARYEMHPENSSISGLVPAILFSTFDPRGPSQVEKAFVSHLNAYVAAYEDGELPIKCGFESTQDGLLTWLQLEAHDPDRFGNQFRPAACCLNLYPSAASDAPMSPDGRIINSALAQEWYDAAVSLYPPRA